MQIEIRHELRVVKCPKCTLPIHVNVGRYVGGMDDDGGMVIQCLNCSRIFPLKAKNPEDLSSVTKNGKRLATWLDALPKDLQKTYNLDPDELKQPDISLVWGNEKTPPAPFIPRDDTFYFRDGINLEQQALGILNSHKTIIEQHHKSAFNFYVKGKLTAKKSFVLLEYQNNGKNCRATFAKQIDNEKDLNIQNLYLVDHSELDLAFQIDGLYPRDQVLIFLERLLNRWRYTAQETILVTPFIGFHYPNTSDALHDLWTWLVMNVDEKKTTLVTRKGTFNLYKAAQAKTGIDFNLLLELGLVEPFLEKMSSKNAKFFEHSHAKYYVGVFDDHVEVLSGSFNIHTGKYLENVTFKSYNKAFFEERYLNKIPQFKREENLGAPEVDELDLSFGEEEAKYDEESVHFISIGPQNKNYQTKLKNIINFTRDLDQEPKFT
jgi:hypothetical protein